MTTAVELFKIDKPVRVKDKLKVTRAKSIVKGPGVVVWEGSSLIDGSPLCVIANGFRTTSKNRKTGPMLQVYILRADIDPWTAITEGKDGAICGDCIHRAQKRGGGGRSCYVQVYPWVTTVWHAYKRGSYTPFAEFNGVGDPFANRDVRIGTYGDPAAVPVEVWERILENAKGVDHVYPSLEELRPKPKEIRDGICR